MASRRGLLVVTSMQPNLVSTPFHREGWPYITPPRILGTLSDIIRRNRPLHGLVQLAGHVVRRHNSVVREAGLTVPRAKTAWALGERPIEIGPENFDTLMTPDLGAFLGGDSARKSLEGIRHGNRLIVVTDAEGYAAYGHIVINSAEYLRVLGERKPVPRTSGTSSPRPAPDVVACS
jgi:hypothetical protein